MNNHSRHSKTEETVNKLSKNQKTVLKSISGEGTEFSYLVNLRLMGFIALKSSVKRLIKCGLIKKQTNYLDLDKGKSEPLSEVELMNLLKEIRKCRNDETLHKITKQNSKVRYPEILLSPTQRLLEFLENGGAI